MSEVQRRDYQQARNGGYLLWQHSCGSVVGCTPDEDPTRDDIDCDDWCHDQPGSWERLYVQGVRSDD